MFIIEQRTAGVLAALASSAAMAVLVNVWDRAHEVAAASTANSTAAGTEPQACARVAVSLTAAPARHRARRTCNW
jgi:hypothetical protein